LGVPLLRSPSSSSTSRASGYMLGMSTARRIDSNQILSVRAVPAASPSLARRSARRSHRVPAMMRPVVVGVAG
jgi:hypothetical protein